jgi:DNA mismatch repair protein MutS2
VAEARALREEARVVAELSGRAQAYAEPARRAFEAAAEADALCALARWAADTRSIAIEPDDEPRLSLRGMRHPLLIGSAGEVVPNDVLLSGGSALVVSGPNAGGKTVALKSLGLAAWMARAGVPIPAEPGSAIGWFSPVLSEVGDDQSLVRSLSTFSAHVENIAAILELAGEHALVLLDEVAAGTDPEEGSALAAAVLEALVARGAAVAVTTHYERLKELAAEGGALQNASMGFDLERMEPNFRLRIGVPGPSSALAVARRHGMPERVVARAKELLPITSIDREELVRQLESERDALERARRDAQAELARQRELSEEMEVERAEVRAKEREKLADEARELISAVRGARAELSRALERVRRPDVDERALRDAERVVNETARQVALGSPLADAARAPQAPGARRKLEPDEVAVGTRVWLPRLGARAEIVELLGRGQVRVLAGALKLVAQSDELELDPSRANPPKDERKKAKSSLEMVDAFVPVRTGGTTLDLRGRRVEEALEEVDAFIDRMLSDGERGAYVLHGHGTGALKAAVREHLAASRYVARAEAADAADGGDAFTVFWLRE